MATAAISFEPDLIGVMSQFSQFEETLKKHIGEATARAALLIGATGQANMHFMHPTERLHDSIEADLRSEYLAWIGSSLPYAHRREFSFKGPDSLGRMFPNDPAMLMFTNALQDDSMLLEVSNLYIEAVFAAWHECIGNLPGGSAAFVSAG